MKPKSGHTRINKHDVLYSHVFYQRDCDGRGEGWYFMLSHSRPYGPFKDKDLAHTILEGLVKRLENGESEDDIRDQG